MSVIESVHEDHGATFGERADRRIVEHYGRPERTHRAVRNGVGLLEFAYGVIVVEGGDRVEYVDNVVSNRVPTEDGQGCYALVLDPQGGIDVELYVYNAGERLLLFTQPEAAEPLAEEWGEKVFIQDVDIRVATDDYAVFGIHGPHATEKIASVLNGAGSPDRRYSFVRGTMGDEGVSVIRTDALTGEESYEVICAADDAAAVHDTLLNQGLNAAPSAIGPSRASRSRPARRSFTPNSRGRSRTCSASETRWISRKGVTWVRRSSPASRIAASPAGDSSG